MSHPKSTMANPRPRAWLLIKRLHPNNYEMLAADEIAAEFAAVREEGKREGFTEGFRAGAAAQHEEDMEVIGEGSPGWQASYMVCGGWLPLVEPPAPVPPK